MTNRLFFDINAHESVYELIIKEQESVGYYHLPTQDISYLSVYKEDFEKHTKEIKHLVVIGIG
ncbi:MAG TPA: glucose-6-phosphate isomerase, partial [Sulfurospirillum sp. UBA11407]